jgi:hypothetical protein
MLPLNFIKGLSLGSGCIPPQELLTGQRFYLILKELGFGQTHGVKRGNMILGFYP